MSKKSMSRKYVSFSPTSVARRVAEYKQKAIKKWTAHQKEWPFNQARLNYCYKRPSKIEYNLRAVDPETVKWSVKNPLRPLDNGGRPFLVDLQDRHVDVYIREEPRPDLRDDTNTASFDLNHVKDDTRMFSKTCFKNLIRVLHLQLTPTDTVFIGDGSYDNFKHDPRFVGCSVLVQRRVNNTIQELTLIASSIESVQIKNDFVTNFKASVGNSGVPYGYAILNSGRIINFEPIGCYQTSEYSLSQTENFSDSEKSCLGPRRLIRGQTLKKKVILRRLFG